MLSTIAHVDPCMYVTTVLLKRNINGDSTCEAVRDPGLLAIAHLALCPSHVNHVEFTQPFVEVKPLQENNQTVTVSP